LAHPKKIRSHKKKTIASSSDTKHKGRARGDWKKGGTTGEEGRKTQKPEGQEEFPYS